MVFLILKTTNKSCAHFNDRKLNLEAYYCFLFLQYTFCQRSFRAFRFLFSCGKPQSWWHYVCLKIFTKTTATTASYKRKNCLKAIHHLRKWVMKKHLRTAIFSRGGSRTAATPKMKHFAIKVNGWKSLTIITKSSILDVAAALDAPLVPQERKMFIKIANLSDNFFSSMHIDSLTSFKSSFSKLEYEIFNW